MGWTIYRCYDRRGKLLYVGCAVDVVKRMYQHKQNAPWFEYVESFTVSRRMRDKDRAFKAERSAIFEELPLFNVFRSSPGLEYETTMGRYKARRERIRKLRSRGWSIRRIAKHFGVSPQRISQFDK